MSLWQFRAVMAAFAKDERPSVEEFEEAVARMGWE